MILGAIFGTLLAFSPPLSDTIITNLFTTCFVIMTCAFSTLSDLMVVDNVYALNLYVQIRASMISQSIILLASFIDDASLLLSACTFVGLCMVLTTVFIYVSDLNETHTHTLTQRLHNPNENENEVLSSLEEMEIGEQSKETT